MNLLLSVLLFGVMSVMSALPVAAATLTITAAFKPDPSKPNHNMFENTTPNTGFCLNYPNFCRNGSLFSLRAAPTIYATQPIPANHENPRQGVMLKAPAEWREVNVTHSATGRQETVRIRINGLGASLVTDPVVDLVGGNVSISEAHALLFGTNLSYAPSPCKGLGPSWSFNKVAFDFFWAFPTSSECAKHAKFTIPTSRLNYIEISYQLITPNPLNMSAGQYTGTITYTMGPHQDFDMGDNFLPDDPVLTLNFILSVDHVLKIEIPPGGNNIALEPKGGWQLWSVGRRPEKLMRDQTFLIHASSRFKMQLACERIIGDTCGLSNSRQHEVPINVSVTLPNGLRHANGASVNRQPLLLSGAGTELFEPTQYVDRKPGTLHFEIDKQYTAEMLFQEGTYKGSVTVIWDSEV